MKTREEIVKYIENIRRTFAPEKFINERIADWHIAEVKAYTRPQGHDGDCTIYSAMANGRCTDGICTCGFGKDAKGMQAGNLFSQERIMSIFPKKEDIN